jgi:hypothetical protein
MQKDRTPRIDPKDMMLADLLLFITTTLHRCHCGFQL